MSVRDTAVQSGFTRLSSRYVPQRSISAPDSFIVRSGLSGRGAPDFLLSASRKECIFPSFIPWNQCVAHDAPKGDISMRVRWPVIRLMILAVVWCCLFSGAVSAMQITAVLPGGRALAVSAEPEDTVEQVKQKIYVMTEISPLNQLIQYKNKTLDEKKTLSSYGISDGDTVRVEHAVLEAPTRKDRSGMGWVLLAIVVIIGIGVYFMRKKPSREYDGK